MYKSQLKQAFWSKPGIATSCHFLNRLAYACRSKLGRTLILSRHLFGKTVCVRKQLPWAGMLFGALLTWPCASMGEVSDPSPHQETALVLTLEEAVQMALEANRNLVATRLNTESADFSLQKAQAEFDWTIAPNAIAGLSDEEKNAAAGVAFGKRFKNGIKTTLAPRVEGNDDDYSGKIGLSLAIPLFRGFGPQVNLDQVKGAAFALKGARISLYLAQVNTVLDTIRTAYDIKKNNDLGRLYAYHLERFKRHSTVAKTKEKVGLATPLDVYRAQIQRRDTENSLTIAREAMQNAADRLKILLAMPIEQSVDISAPLEFERVSLTLSEAVHVAFENRVELKFAYEKVSENERQAVVAKHNLKPQLDLAFDYQRISATGDPLNVYLLDEDRWFVSITSDSDWRRTAEKLSFKQSLLGVKSSRLNARATQDTIQQQVRMQLQGLIKDAQRITIRQKQIDDAAGKLALAKIKFNHHMASNFDLIEAETELQRAKANLVATKVNYIIGTYRLRAAMGTLVDHALYP
jgi:outer membrane protein TolC